jgi:hypothetical protein
MVSEMSAMKLSSTKCFHLNTSSPSESTLLHCYESRYNISPKNSATHCFDFFNRQWKQRSGTEDRCYRLQDPTGYRILVMQRCLPDEKESRRASERRPGAVQGGTWDNVTADRVPGLSTPIHLGSTRIWEGYEQSASRSPTVATILRFAIKFLIAVTFDFWKLLFRNSLSHLLHYFGFIHKHLHNCLKISLFIKNSNLVVH